MSGRDGAAVGVADRDTRFLRHDPPHQEQPLALDLDCECQLAADLLDRLRQASAAAEPEADQFEQRGLAHPNRAFDHVYAIVEPPLVGSLGRDQPYLTDLERRSHDAAGSVILARNGRSSASGKER